MAGVGLPPVLISVKDDPPLLALKNAITATTPTGKIELVTGFPPVQISAYINMYFSEVAQLSLGESRSFQILFNDEPLFDSPTTPPSDTYLEIYASGNFSSKTTLLLAPTDDSSLPPLINAMEVFQVGDAMTDGTNTDDGEKV